MGICDNCNSKKFLPSKQVRDTHVFCAYWVEVQTWSHSCVKWKPQEMDIVIRQNELVINSMKVTKL